MYLLLFSYPFAEAREGLSPKAEVSPGKRQDSIQKSPLLTSGPPKAEIAPSLEESRAKAEEARLQAESVIASYDKSIRQIRLRRTICPYRYLAKPHLPLTKGQIDLV